MFTDDGGTAETVTSDDLPVERFRCFPCRARRIGFTATAGDGRVRLRWGNPSNTGGVPGIPRCDTSTATPPAPRCPTARPGATQYNLSILGALIDGLTNGTAHAFEVRAVNSVGGGPPATATATPMTVACPAPVLGNRRQRWRGDLTIDARTPPNGDAPAFSVFMSRSRPAGGQPQRHRLHPRRAGIRHHRGVGGRSLLAVDGFVPAIWCSVSIGT